MQANGEVKGESVGQDAGAWSQVQRAHHAHVEPSPLDALQYLVYIEGGSVVGPVSANQVARGMREGRVTSEASIQAVGEVFWTGLLDEPAVIAALKSI